MTSSGVLGPISSRRSASTSRARVSRDLLLELMASVPSRPALGALTAACRWSKTGARVFAVLRAKIQVLAGDARDAFRWRTLRRTLGKQAKASSYAIAAELPAQLQAE